MTNLMTFSADEIAPDHEAVLRIQGIPAGKAVHGGIEGLYGTALTLLRGLVRPRGVMLELSRVGFESIYHGDGRNESPAPIGEISSKAHNLALFAATLGEETERKIRELFSTNEFPLGYILDSAASVAADNMAKICEKRYLGLLQESGAATFDSCALAYSPGYCGWHISGQRRLFESLHPEQIGISLTESFLMQPLKSISGVLIAGPKSIHIFSSSYSFCGECETRSCRERMSAVRTT